MLAEGELDAVFVMTPPEQHAPMSLAAIERGLAVMCEKPLAASLGEAGAMARAATARGVATAVNFTYRSSPGPRLVARLVRNGAIGGLLAAELAYLQGRGLVQAGPFRDPLADLGAHLFDALRWWCGPLTRVGAAASVEEPRSWSLAGTLASGASVALTISRIATGRGNALLATLYGQRGALRLEFDVESVSVARCEVGSTEWQEVPIPPELRLTYAEFPTVHVDRLVGALRGDQAWPTFADGLAVQEVIEAAQRSAASGRFLALPLEP